MKHKAVLFDLDGTLLDTLADLADSMNRALSRLGCPPHETDAYRYFVGDGIAEMARRALPEGSRDEQSVEKCIAAAAEEYARRWAERTRPYEGVAELLDELAARGVKMAVLSNKPDHFTKLIVSELLPHWKFQAVRGALPDVPRKPDPGAAIDLAAAMGVPPAEVLYLGDTNTDMQTAVAAGMYAVGAAWGFRSPEELTAAGAAVVISHPAELLVLL